MDPSQLPPPSIPTNYGVPQLHGDKLPKNYHTPQLRGSSTQPAGILTERAALLATSSLASAPEPTARWKTDPDVQATFKSELESISTLRSVGNWLNENLWGFFGLGEHLLEKADDAAVALPTKFTQAIEEKNNELRTAHKPTIPLPTRDEIASYFAGQFSNTQTREMTTPLPQFTQESDFADKIIAAVVSGDAHAMEAITAMAAMPEETSGNTPEELYAAKFIQPLPFLFNVGDLPAAATQAESMPPETSSSTSKPAARPQTRTPVESSSSAGIAPTLMALEQTPGGRDFMTIQLKAYANGQKTVEDVTHHMQQAKAGGGDLTEAMRALAQSKTPPETMKRCLDFCVKWAESNETNGAELGALDVSLLKTELALRSYNDREITALVARLAAIKEKRL